ncbi:MAG TPA: peptidase M23, partial [Chromatiales bacterium]|nr:peptidase M23 [Chromatiales bacterium]
GEGDAVYAVAPGQVVFADWLRGFGLLLIVDHGQGYLSLYGHNQSLFKELGEWVEVNDTIASVGNSGGHRGIGLYFEIRHDGQPVDPGLWCRLPPSGRLRSG